MGGIVKGVGGSTGATNPPATSGAVGGVTGVIGRPGSLELQVAQLTKIVHLLVKELAEVEKYIKVSPDGITFQSGISQVAVLSSGVSIKSSKVRFKSATQDETRV